MRIGYSFVSTEGGRARREDLPQLLLGVEAIPRWERRVPPPREPGDFALITRILEVYFRQYRRGDLPIRSGRENPGIPASHFDLIVEGERPH